MARVCDLTGKRRQIGNKVSHSNIKTKTKKQVNLQTKKVYDPNNIELDFSDPKARRAAYESCATKGEVMAGASLEYKYAADKHLAVLLRKLR